MAHHEPLKFFELDGGKLHQVRTMLTELAEQGSEAQLWLLLALVGQLQASKQAPPSAISRDNELLSCPSTPRYLRTRQGGLQDGMGPHLSFDLMEHWLMCSRQSAQNSAGIQTLLDVRFHGLELDEGMAILMGR